jgi:hypothetical protein
MRARGLPPAVVLALVVGASTIGRFVAARAVDTPRIVPDELLYGLLGRSLYESGRLHVLGGDAGYYSLVYPALAGLPLRLPDLERGYQLLKLLQALVMSATAVPVYLWGRSLMRPRWALVAAALTVAIPALAFSGLVMTEVAYYPAVTLAAWAAARALARPSRARNLLLATAIAAAVGTRLQGLVLIPAVLTAIVLKAALERNLRGLTAYWRLGAAGLAVGIVVVAAGSSSLGGYSVVAHGGYAPGAVARFVLYHAAALLLLCGVAPACALALLAIDAVRGREHSADARAAIAVAVSFCAWTVLEVGVFASRYVGHIAERDLIGTAPLLFLAFALWLDRGAPRATVTASVVAFAAAALVVALPYKRLVTITGLQDSMTFAAALAGTTVDPLLYIGLPAVALAALTALLPARVAPVLAVLLAVGFAAASVSANREVEAAATRTQALLIGPERRWIDRASDGPVAYVFGGGAYFSVVWENAFWNRRVRAVYDVKGARVLGPMPQAALDLRGDGVMRARGATIRERYAVLPSSLTPAGREVARSALVGSDQAATVLWRLDGTPRLLEARAGFDPNGDVRTRATVREYDCARGGSFAVTLLGKVPGTIDLQIDGATARTVELVPDVARTETVDVPGRPGTCTLGLQPSTTVGTTVIAFARR